MQYIIVEKRTFMDTYELVVPCHFGLEAVTKREIYDLGYEITRVEAVSYTHLRAHETG